MVTEREDGDVRMLLRAAMDDVSTSATPQIPSWSLVEKGLNRKRRRRQAGLLARTGASALVLSTLAVGAVQSTVVPYPAWGPTVVSPLAASHSAQFSDATRGSLATDQAWLAALRKRVTGQRVEREPGDERWRPPAASECCTPAMSQATGSRWSKAMGSGTR